MSTFEKDLIRARLAEAYVAYEYGSKYGITPEVAPNAAFKPWDFRIMVGAIDPTREWLRVEVKNDEIATDKLRRFRDLHRTTVMFELFCGWDASGKRIKSGLAATEADDWAHVVDAVMYVFDVEDLRRQARHAWADKRIRDGCGDGGRVLAWIPEFNEVRRMVKWQRKLIGHIPRRDEESLPEPNFI